MARHPQAELGPEDQDQERHRADQGIAEIQRWQRLRQGVQLADVIFRRVRQLQAEEVLDLHGGDGDGDTGGKAERHRQRNVLDQPAKARQPHQQQKHPGDQRGDQQAGQSELLRNRIQDHHEGGGGAGDAVARTAADGDDDPGDGGGIQAVLRRHAAGDRQRHRQRDGDNTDRHPGDSVFQQPRQAIRFPPAGVYQRAEGANFVYFMRFHLRCVPNLQK